MIVEWRALEVERERLFVSFENKSTASLVDGGLEVLLDEAVVTALAKNLLVVHKQVEIHRVLVVEVFFEQQRASNQRVLLLRLLIRDS